MKKYWWKILCMIFMTYTVLMGLLIPLGSGITSVSPNGAKVLDTLTMQVKCYNTHFEEAKNSTKAFLKNDEFKMITCANSVKVLDDEHLELKFIIPYMPVKNDDFIFADLVLNNDKDGNIMQDEAIRIDRINMLNIAINSTPAPSSKTTNCTDSITVTKATYIHFPYRSILYESIRNLYFHVPMWFTMMLIISISLIYSIKYLRSFDLNDDIIAVEASKVGIFFGVLGLITGSIWARFTWGAWWVNDVKVNGAAVTLLIYFAYLILRNSVDDAQKRARIAAVYSIIAFTMLVLFLIIFPRMNDSLHPGNGGNPGFSKYDLDSTMRMVFYPAVIGWCLLGLWILNIRIRMNKLMNKEI
jgi:heme exporter protein C